MFVSEEMVREMECRFGVPTSRDFILPATTAELQRIRSSQKDGRDHDVTLYIEKDSKLIVIAKHAYPPGLFRAPSGGIHPGESILEGIHREAHEETGCEIEVVRFILRTSVEFRPIEADRGDATVDWRSFVFLAEYLSGDFAYTDHHEISAVRLADWSEFEAFGRIMRQSDSAGLHYRAKLHEAVCDALGR
jgi:8-oxo-dGTP pyrophosphatase MutT (NUDIX family)